jgi:hypothetical protein
MEVAPCVFNFFGNVANGKEETLFCDVYGGQNRNINTCLILIHAVRTLNIPTINQCFSFKPVHSQMEVDSAHAKIEKYSRHVDVFDPVT